MKYDYVSIFGPRIKGFINQKNALGISYVSFEPYLRDFDRFCIENYPMEKQMTKEMCFAWAVRRKGEICNNSFRNRLIPIREFAKYLNRIGEQAYILHSNFAKKEPAKPPYIYTQSEIRRMWEVLDGISPRKAYPIYHFVIPTAIKLLYYCGLRPSEARRLSTSDVDFDKGRLIIRESKQHKSRIVMMSDGVADMLEKYNRSVSIIMPDRQVFFPTYQGKMYEKEGLTAAFHSIRDKAGINGKNGSAPRLYDFRHTFATHRLYEWMKEGRNLYAMIPYLSAYMGHAQLADTYYYIHFVPGMAESMTGCSFATGENLIPDITLSGSATKKIARNHLGLNPDLGFEQFNLAITANLIPEV